MKNQNQSSALSLGNMLPKPNVSNVERIIMVAGGAYLLYKVLKKKESGISKMGVGGAMLLRGLTGYCPMYQAVSSLNDNATGVDIRVTTVINRPILQVYAFWRNLENLPKFMSHLESVENINNDTTEWTAKGPMNIGSISWTAKITREEKDKYLSWKSLAGSSVENVGKVSFRPIGQATEIDVIISYKAPLGLLGEKAAKIFNPYFENMVKQDIENLKDYMESGQQ